MPRKKKDVDSIEHVKFGHCVIITAGTLDSGGDKYFRVKCNDGDKQLLAAPEYWRADETKIDLMFTKYHLKAVVDKKKDLAHEHEKDANSKEVIGRKRDRSRIADKKQIAAIEDRIEDIQTEIEDDDENTSGSETVDATVTESSW